MDIPRLDALNRYWRKNPPLHILVAGYLGYKGEEEKPSEQAEQDLANLLGQFPQAPR